MSEAEIKKPASGLGYRDRALASHIAFLRSFTISPNLAAKIEEIAAESGLSESEILQAGISLVELAVKTRAQGKKFGVVEQDTPMVTEVVGL